MAEFFFDGLGPEIDEMKFKSAKAAFKFLRAREPEGIKIHYPKKFNDAFTISALKISLSDLGYGARTCELVEILEGC